MVVDANKDALGFRKITGNASSGNTAFFEYTGTTGDDYAVRGHVSGATGGSYAIGGTNLSATGFGVRGVASHATGINYGGYFQSSSSAGYGLQAVTTVAGGIPAYIQAFDAADNNPNVILVKGGRQLRLNPRSVAAGYNPVVPVGAQTIIGLGPAGAIDTGVLFIGPHATDSVGVLMDATTDTVTISGATTIGNIASLGLSVTAGATIIKRVTGAFEQVVSDTSYSDANIYHWDQGTNVFPRSLRLFTAIATGTIRVYYTMNTVTSTLNVRILVNGSVVYTNSSANAGIVSAFTSINVTPGDVVVMQAYYATVGTHTIYNVQIGASTQTLAVV